MEPGALQAVEQAMLRQNPEKTSLDKITARIDIDRLRELVRKDTLTRQDLLEIHYLLTSAESKLYNFSEHERWIINLFYVWINEMVSIAEDMSCYSDEITKKNKTLRMRNKKILDNITITNQHTIKFLCEVYINICRTSLSVRGYLIQKIVDNKYEIVYDDKKPQLPQGMGRMF